MSYENCTGSSCFLLSDCLALSVLPTRKMSEQEVKDLMSTKGRM